MTDVHDMSQPRHPAAERPLPWDHWSRARREWTALGGAAALVVLAAVAALLALAS